MLNDIFILILILFLKSDLNIVFILIFRESENQANFSLRSDHDIKTEESFVKDEEFDMEDDWNKNMNPMNLVYSNGITFF